MGPKSWTRLTGVVIVAAGLLSLPVGLGVSPKRDTSFFHNLADLDGFSGWGVVVIGTGIVILILSILVPAGEEE